ncbi:MAG: recombinase [Flavobacterium sp. BFFFF2]|nr:MAG: recombinase [Flavobacterium sp. BFFFF2]
MSSSNKSTFGLLFYLKRSKEKMNGECPIMLRITINGISTAFAIQRSVKPDDWDPKRGISKGKTSQLNALNVYIDALRAKAYNKYTEQMSLHDEVTTIMLRDAILGINQSKPRFLLEEWADQCADLKKQIGNGRTYASFQKSNTCRTFMADFISIQYKCKDVTLKSIDPQLINKFALYLRTERKCMHNTAMKYLQVFKKSVLIGYANGWIKTNPFNGIQLTLEEVDRPYLTEDELKSLIELQFRMKRLELVRDMFVFSCFTGLAYADVYSLTKADLEKTPDGKLWIKTRRQKTNVKAHIPILPIAKAILDKYCQNFDMLSASDRLLPMISNQKANSYLKEISELSGIEKNLSFHVARHTFATTVTLMNGVPIESVSRMLGHKNIKSTQHYAKIVDTKIGEDMYKLENILDSKMVYAGF